MNESEHYDVVVVGGGSGGIAVAASLLKRERGLSLDGEQPTRLAWILKANMLPWIYWEAMLKGREWMTNPIHQV